MRLAQFVIATNPDCDQLVTYLHASAAWFSMIPDKSEYIERRLLLKGAVHQNRRCPQCSQPEVYWIAGFKGQQWYPMLHPDIEEHNYMCRACGYTWIEGPGGQPPG